MTLTENFKASINFPTKATLDNCVKISEEFAIGFADWKDKFINQVADWKLDGVFLKNKYTTKELLEIYKKQ
mgnify:CR=1 FL=1